jgi:hypothetical protein
MNKRKLDALDNIEENVHKCQKTENFGCNLSIDCILHIVSYLDLKTTSLFRLTCKNMLTIIDDYLLSPLHNQSLAMLEAALDNEKIDYIKAHKLKAINDLSEDNNNIRQSYIKYRMIELNILPSYIFSSQELFEWLQPSRNCVIRSMLNNRIGYRIDLFEKMVGLLTSDERDDVNIEDMVKLFATCTPTIIHKRIIDLFDIEHQKQIYYNLYVDQGGDTLVDYYYRFNIQEPIPLGWFKHLSSDILNSSDRNCIKKFKFLLDRKEYKESRIDVITHLLDISNSLTDDDQVSAINLLIEYGKLKYEEFPALCIEHPEFIAMFLSINNWNPTTICADPSVDPIYRMISYYIKVSKEELAKIIMRLERHPNWNPPSETLYRHVIALKGRRYNFELKWWLASDESKYRPVLEKYLEEIDEQDWLDG